MQRLEALKADAGFPRVVFQRLTAEEPETLKEIAKSLQIPRGPFVEWFTVEHSALYDAALKVLASEYGEESVSIADQATPETAGVAKLRVDARLKVASKFDRSRYGEADQGPRGPAVVIQVAQLRGPKIVEAEILPVLPAEAAL